MAKGAVLNKEFVEMLGLGDHLLTLTGAMINKPHEVLLEPMFHIHTEEIDETIYLERKYLYESQLPIKASYASGEHILIWTYRAVRYRNNEEGSEAQNVLLAQDLFLLGDAHEFQRFRQFLKTKRILDAQSRDFLARNHEQFPRICESDEGMSQILDCLANMQEWPDPENGFRKHSGNENTLEGVAKQYSASLAAVRNSSLLAKHMLQRDPDGRLRIFRIMSHTEDPDRGPAGLIAFIRDIGSATKREDIIKRTAHISNGMELSRALESIRQYLVTTEIPRS